MAVTYENFMKEIAKSGNLFKARFNSMETVKKLLDEIPPPYSTIKIGTFAALDYDGDQQYVVIGGSEMTKEQCAAMPILFSKYNSMEGMITSNYSDYLEGIDDIIGDNPPKTKKKSFIDRNEFLKTVSIGKRFVHYIVDIILGVYAFSFLLGTVFGMLGIHRVLDRINPFIFGILILAVYYIFCEFLFNRTIGKLFTGSVVVTENGDKPSFGIVLLRTLIRFVPFEPFSILSASTKMWHDTWTKTTVVKSKSLK